jgi:cytochrome c biogenesis protein
MKGIFKFLSSIKLAIVLIIILAVASILGTLFPQAPRGLDPVQYGQWLAQVTDHMGKIANWLDQLQILKLYRSFWFLALLVLFTLNIVVCTLTRLSPKLRRASRPKIESDPQGLLSLKIKDRFKRNAPLADVRAEVEQRLKASHYRIRSAAAGPRHHLLARKKIGGIFGSDVVHVGLLIILAGAIISSLTSVRQDLQMKEGDVLPVPHTVFALRLDKFATHYYPDGSVKDWISSITVMEDGKAVRTKDIEVNRPLSYKGYNFYQTSYGWNWDAPSVEIWVKKKADGAVLRKLKIKVGERAALEDADGTTIAVARFLPDFVLGENNQPETRSLQPDNPAALVEAFRGGAKAVSGWVFANYPDWDQMHAANADPKAKEAAKPFDLAFELKSFEAGQYSVLEAAKDPGVPLIWLGCILVMAGLALAFYWPTWEIKAVLEETQGKTDIILGGIAAKSRDAFGTEFSAVADALRRSK